MTVTVLNYFTPDTVRAIQWEQGVHGSRACVPRMPKGLAPAVRDSSCHLPSRSGFRQSVTARTSMLDSSPIPETGGSNDTSLLTGDGEDLRSTQRLVETAMLAATAALVFYLSLVLRIESYFSSFLPLPIVLSSVKWGISAGRKTMLATALLLFVLGGPVRAISYMLVHGFVGLAMGTMWRWEISWLRSIAFCTLVRGVGLVAFLGLSSWLVRENLLTAFLNNAQATLAYLFSSIGSPIVPSYTWVLVGFVTLIVVNCVAFTVLLHFLYAIFFKRMGLEAPFPVPKWLRQLM